MFFQVFARIAMRFWLNVSPQPFRAETVSWYWGTQAVMSGWERMGFTMSGVITNRFTSTVITISSSPTSAFSTANSLKSWSHHCKNSSIVSRKINVKFVILLLASSSCVYLTSCDLRTQSMPSALIHSTTAPARCNISPYASIMMLTSRSV